MLAVKVEATATPLLLVVAVVVAVPLAKVPLAPLDGAVNMTVCAGRFESPFSRNDMGRNFHQGQTTRAPGVHDSAKPAMRALCQSLIAGQKGGFSGRRK